MQDPFGGGVYTVTGVAARCVERSHGELRVTMSAGDVATLRME